jgi:hypothetical protein
MESHSEEQPPAMTTSLLVFFALEF